MAVHQEEILRVREWNRGLLLGILDAESIAEERQTPITNLKAQMAIRATVRCMKVLCDVGYKDGSMEDTADAQYRRSMRTTHLRRFQEAADEYNFIAARRILVRAVKDFNVEQQYDLDLLIRGCDLPSVFEDECYTLSRSPYLESVQEESRTPAKGTKDYV